MEARSGRRRKTAAEEQLVFPFMTLLPCASSKAAWLLRGPVPIEIANGKRRQLKSLAGFRTPWLAVAANSRFADACPLGGAEDDVAKHQELAHGEDQNICNQLRIHHVDAHPVPQPPNQ